MPVAVEEDIADSSSVLARQSRLASSTGQCDKRVCFPGSSDYAMCVDTLRLSCLHWLVLSSAYNIFLCHLLVR